MIVKGGKCLSFPRLISSSFLCYDSFHCWSVLIVDSLSLNESYWGLLNELRGIGNFSQRLAMDVNEFWLLNKIGLAGNERGLIELIGEALTGTFSEDKTVMVQHKRQLVINREVAGYDTLWKLLAELLVYLLLWHLPLHLWILAHNIELNLNNLLWFQRITDTHVSTLRYG